MELPFVFACLFVVSLIDVYSQIIFIFQVGESARPVFCFFDESGEYASEVRARKRKKLFSSFPTSNPLHLSSINAPWFTPYRILFAPQQKPYQIRLLFTHKNCKLSGAISVTEQSCAVPISKVKRHKSYRFCGILWCSVNTYSARRGSK